MGEVYQAEDQKLRRNVAVKVLPEEFAGDADRLFRFQREAKLLASLNHPNIASIHGLEESEGVHFLIMELVEGQTLANRIKAGPIPIEEALKLALQIAEALEAAHKRGVIHRDLKPSNIKITPEGKVKVLDFGLAKAYAEEMSRADLASPTISDAVTRQGVILGTAAYMSQEQARGKSIDKRADIWAFGVVLFEMLTGKRLFTGETVTETLAAVIKGEPEWNSLPKELHPRVGFSIEQCLEKDPENRYSSISDARVDIRKVMENSDSIRLEPVTVAKQGTNLKTVLPWVTAAIILTAVAAGFMFRKMNPPQQHDIVRLEHILPKGQRFNVPSSTLMRLGHTLAVSPDGTRVALTISGNNPDIYIWDLADLHRRSIGKPVMVARRH